VIRLAVRVAADQAEIVLAELLELAPSGVEEVELPDGAVEYAVYGAPGELPSLPALTAAAGEALVEIRTSEVGEGWEERWREFHRPLVLGTSLTVRPPWEPRGETDLDLVVDPGRAFGTGAHPTTRLCLELLLELPGAGPFVDLGCGSGVLAIAAARLGYRPVIAFDHDPLAISATAANARANDAVIDQVQRLDLRSDPLPALGGATVTANLLAPLLKVLAGRLAGAAEAETEGVAAGVPATLIASGLLVGETDAVAAAFASAGLREVERRTQGEWGALLLAAG
jgi:ribosomal protein L11 methyltransferase